MTQSAQESFPDEKPQIPLDLAEQAGLEVLDFEALALGDQVLLHFDSGIHALVIDRRDDDGQIYARLKVARKHQLTGEVRDWEDNPHHLRLIGACDGVRMERGKPTIVGQDSGWFIVGKNAWLSFTTDAGEKNLITNKVESIKRQSGNT